MNWVCPTKASSLRTLYKSVWALFSNSGIFLVAIPMDLFVSLRRGFVILVFRFQRFISCCNKCSCCSVNQSGGFGRLSEQRDKTVRTLTADFFGFLVYFVRVFVKRWPVE